MGVLVEMIEYDFLITYSAHPQVLEVMQCFSSCDDNEIIAERNGVFIRGFDFKRLRPITRDEGVTTFWLNDDLK